MTLCTLIIALLFPAPVKSHPPTGWIDCGFTE
jgi:hypothetical protein